MHFLVIPKSRDGLTQLSKAVDSNKALLGHLMFIAQKVAKEQVRRSVDFFSLFSLYLLAL